MSRPKKPEDPAVAGRRKLAVAGVVLFALAVSWAAMAFLGNPGSADPQEAAQAIEGGIRKLGDRFAGVRVVLTRGRKDPDNARVRVIGGVRSEDDRETAKGAVRGACRSARFDFKRVEFLVAVTASTPEKPKE